jgi:hypothetical protein
MTVTGTLLLAWFGVTIVGLVVLTLLAAARRTSFLLLPAWLALSILFITVTLVSNP